MLLPFPYRRSAIRSGRIRLQEPLRLAQRGHLPIVEMVRLTLNVHRNHADHRAAPNDRSEHLRIHAQLVDQDFRRAHRVGAGVVLDEQVMGANQVLVGRVQSGVDRRAVRIDPTPSATASPTSSGTPAGSVSRMVVRLAPVAASNHRQHAE